VKPIKPEPEMTESEIPEIYELTHARHDPATCLVPGLFRSLMRGERKKEKLDITYTHGKSSVRFWGPEPLGADDLRVLQGLVAMAAVSGPNRRGITLRPEPITQAGKELREALEMRWDAVERDALVVQGSFSRLTKEIGYAEDGGKQIGAIRKCIERLWAVSVIVERLGRRQGFRILSDYGSDEKSGQLHVALNPRFLDSVLGVGKRYTHIEMAEVRALRTDPARLIHQRLCGWIDPGKSGRVEIATLCGYVWPDAASDATHRQRRVTMRRVMAELAEIGWSVEEYAKNKWDIRRPKA